MKRYLITFVLLLAPLTALAHVPVIEGSAAVQEKAGVTAIQIADPTRQSLAAYGAIEQPGEIDVYSFIPTENGKIPLEVLVPVRVSHENFHPSALVASLALPLLENPPLEIPDGYGAMLVKAPGLGSRSVFYEPFSFERLYHGNKIKLDVQAGKEYLVFVFDEGQQTGDYTLGLGTVENFENVSFGGLIRDLATLKLRLNSVDAGLLKEIVGLFLLLAGFVIGLGAVTVIDMLGFLGRKSPYWTQTTIRAHKITKPLIWIGMILAIIGGIIFYSTVGWTGLVPLHVAIALALLANGAFLSFVVSPYLLEQERKGKDKKLLPKSLQMKITASFIVSFVGWWSSLLIVVWHLLVLR